VSATEPTEIHATAIWHHSGGNSWHIGRVVGTKPTHVIQDFNTGLLQSARAGTHSETLHFYSSSRPYPHKECGRKKWESVSTCLQTTALRTRAHAHTHTRTRLLYTAWYTFISGLLASVSLWQYTFYRPILTPPTPLPPLPKPSLIPGTTEKETVVFH